MNAVQRLMESKCHFLWCLDDEDLSLTNAYLEKIHDNLMRFPESHALCVHRRDYHRSLASSLLEIAQNKGHRDEIRAVGHNIERIFEYPYQLIYPNKSCVKFYDGSAPNTIGGRHDLVLVMGVDTTNKHLWTHLSSRLKKLVPDRIVPQILGVSFSSQVPEWIASHAEMITV